MKNINWKNATPEQLLLWKHASGLIAYNTIEPVVFFGAITASEFTIYAATKLYIALECNFNGIRGNSAVTLSIILHNEADAACAGMVNGGTFWDTATKYYINNIDVKNFYFSRLIAAGYYFMIFKGYRLTIV